MNCYWCHEELTGMYVSIGNNQLANHCFDSDEENAFCDEACLEEYLLDLAMVIDDSVEED